MADILQNVEEDKREKWSKKYERYSEGEWNRHNFESKLEDIKNDISSIEDNITDLQERRREITGVPKRKSPDDMEEDEFGEIKGSFFDQKISEFGKDQFKSLLKKDLGGENPTLKALDDKRDQLQKIRKKEAEWKSLQFELANLAVEKLESISVNYKKQFKSSEVAQDFEKHAQQIVESKVEQAKSEIKQELSQEVAELEQVTNSARNEIKNGWKFFEKFGDVFSEYLEKEKIGELEGKEERLKQLAQEAVEEGLEKYATERGTMDFSGEELEADEKQKDRRQARESATSSLDLAKYELEGKQVDEQHKILRRMSENEEVLEMTPGEVADLTDVSEEELVDVLDNVEEEHGTRFGID